MNRPTNSGAETPSLSARLTWPVATFGVCALILVGFVSLKGSHLSAEYGRQTEMLRQVESDVVLHHLWLEEYLAGDEAVRPEELNRRMLRAGLGVTQLRRIGAHENGSPEARQAVRARLAELDRQIAELGAAADRRIRKRDGAQAGGDQDVSYDATFAEFLDAVQSAHQAVEAHHEAERISFRRATIALATVSLLFAGVLVVRLRQARRERREARARLKASEQRYRQLVEDQTTLICRFSHDGTIHFANDTFATYVGCTEAGCRGESFYGFLGTDDRQELRRRLQRPSEARPDLLIECPLPDASGERRWFRWSFHAIFDEDSILHEIQAAGVDVTESRHARERLIFQQRAQTTYAALSRKILEDPTNVSVIAEHILEAGLRLTGARFGFVGGRDPADGQIDCFAMTESWLIESDATDTDLEPALDAPRSDLNSTIADLIDAQEPLLTNDAAGDPRLDRLRHHVTGPRRLLAVPAAMSGGIAGIIVLADAQRDFDNDDLAVAEQLADLQTLAFASARALDALREREEQYRSLVQLAPEAIFLLHPETGRFLDANPETEKFFGRSRSELLETHPGELSPERQPSGESSFELAQRKIHDAREGGHPVFEWRHLNADGETIHAEVRLSAIESGGRTVVRAMLVDITERKEAEDRVRHLAYYDSLTDLPNRSLFRDRLQQATERLRRTGVGFALFMLDLDHFKNVNDTLGHHIGDGLLRAVAERLRDSVRSVDTVSRLGGDEFAILQTDVSTPADASKLASKVLTELSTPFTVEEHEIRTGTSIGIRLALQDNDADPDELMRQADIALYTVKERGRGTFAFHTEEMTERVRATLKRVRELERALEDDDLHLAFQPVVRRDGTTEGFEALLRWHGTDGDDHLPGDFLPTAEQHGLIWSISEWVSHAATASARALPAHMNEQSYISLNVSSSLLRDASFVDALLSKVAGAGVERGAIEVEVPIRALGGAQLGEVRRQLLRLHEGGIGLAVDDFGRGPMPLREIARLPFRRLKVPVRLDVGQEDWGARHELLLSGCISLGHALDLPIVLKGVETAEQAASAWRLRVDAIQGFVHGEPGTLEAVIEERAEATRPREREGR